MSDSTQGVSVHMSYQQFLQRNVRLAVDLSSKPIAMTKAMLAEMKTKINNE
jgi:predicted GTPase